MVICVLWPRFCFKRKCWICVGLRPDNLQKDLQSLVTFLLSSRKGMWFYNPCLECHRDEWHYVNDVLSPVALSEVTSHFTQRLCYKRCSFRSWRDSIPLKKYQPYKLGLDPPPQTRSWPSVLEAAACSRGQVKPQSPYITACRKWNCVFEAKRNVCTVCLGP